MTAQHPDLPRRPSRRRGSLRLALLLGLTTLGTPATARDTRQPTARELHVVTSGAFTTAFEAPAAKYERETGVHAVTEHGPSMGDTPQASPNRLARHEPADVVILARSGLDKLAAQDAIAPGTSIDLGLSKIAMAVKAGAPMPDISTSDAFRSTLLNARTIAWSDSASGVYIHKP